jgi:hypothetical protein
VLVVVMVRLADRESAGRPLAADHYVSAYSGTPCTLPAAVRKLDDQIITGVIPEVRSPGSAIMFST